MMRRPGCLASCVSASACLASQHWRATCLARGGGPVVGCCSAAPQFLLQFFVLVVTALRDLVADRGFKEVKSVVLPYLLEMRNTDLKTPQELFTESHKELLKEGEAWIKGTATACTVVGALIVTIMFAATITVPGGNNGEGSPMFLEKQKNMFKLYIISDAVSLVSASTSLLMFLSILTSRYAENDFLTNLPTKMIIGLFTLIFSIVAMMITFCASLFLILPKKLSMTIPLACVAGIPAVIYTIIQARLLIHMFISTYGSRILDKKVTPVSQVIH